MTIFVRWLLQDEMDLQFKKSVEILYIVYFISVRGYTYITRANRPLHQFVAPTNFLLAPSRGPLTRQVTTSIIAGLFYNPKYLLYIIRHNR